MAQPQNYRGQVELNCNADKIYDIWVRNIEQISKACPDRISKIEVLEGESCHSLGAVVSWTYVTPEDGKVEIVKTKLEEIDEENRSCTHSTIEGNILNKYYQSCKEKIQVIPRGENCCIVKYDIEVEKKSDDAPDPNLYHEFFIGCVKDVYLALYSSA